MLAGLDAENEILHTLAFLAGVMFWSQVHYNFFFFLGLEGSDTLFINTDID